MSPWLWAFRITFVTIGALGLALWVAAVYIVFFRGSPPWPRWQDTVSVVLFGATKLVVSILLILIGLGGAGHARTYAWFIGVPVLVASTGWNWFVKWRFPEHRSSD
jgi:hypothetical protein